LSLLLIKTFLPTLQKKGSGRTIGQITLGPTTQTFKLAAQASPSRTRVAHTIVDNPARRITVVRTRMFDRNPILDVPLTSLFRPDIALSLQQVLRLYTIGNLVDQWQDPRDQRRIEQLFENPDQARHAVNVCAAWLGFDPMVMKPPAGDPWLDGNISVVGTLDPAAALNPDESSIANLLRIDLDG